MKKFAIVEYEGDAVYEPAEGGYYVPILEVSRVSEKQYGYKHALRAFRKEAEAITAYYGEPVHQDKTYARWVTGNYVGDEIILYIENADKIGEHTERYYGYC